MRRLLLALSLALLTASGAGAQSASWVFTNPSTPSPDALRRLNLTTQWSRHVPMEGQRDGLMTVIVTSYRFLQLPGEREPRLMNPELLVQTRSGQVTAIDAETGQVLWRTRQGNPYRSFRAMGYNDRSVFFANSNYLFSVDRRTGSLQFRTRLPAGLAAAPVVGELALFVPTVAGRLTTFSLPVTDFLASRGGGGYGLATSLAPAGESTAAGEGAFGPQPAAVAEADTGIDIDFSPIQTAGAILCVSGSGQLVAYDKNPASEGRMYELYRFNSRQPLTDGTISVQPGQYERTAFVGSDDANVYALDIIEGRVLWRHTAGTPVTRSPVALNDGVYVTSARGGLARLDRKTGDGMWRVAFGGRVRESNPEADRFLATNNRFVYATDESGRLLILDHKRGTRLSMLASQEFNVPVPNGVTDRVYLAANNGLIVCLRDRDQVEPIRHRRGEEELSNPVRKLLDQEISIAIPAKKPFGDAVKDFVTKHRIPVRVIEVAFTEAGVPGVMGLEVQIPAVQNRPAGEVLQGVLKQINATYQIIGGGIVVIPGKARR